MKNTIFTLSLLVCVILTSTAQTPQLFNYQATLRNNNGQLLVSDDVSIRISILQYSTNGSPVYAETHAVATTSQGIVNLKIGSGSGAGEFAAINWSNGPYFMKIEIDTENTGTYTELGVTQLLSVPYALYAEKANSVLNDSVSYWSKNLNNLYYNDGLVGIGTASPLNKLSIVGNEEEWPGRIFLSIRNQNFGPKSLAYLKIYTGSEEAGTSLGHISPTYTANASPADIAGYGILASSDKGMIISATKPDLSPGIIKFFNGQTSDTKFIETMRISENGNVGIGTTNPTTKLYIEGNVQDGQDRALLRLRNTDAGEKSSVSLALESNDRTYGTAFTQTSASYSSIPDFDRMGVISTNGKGFSIYSLSDYGSIRFYTNQNENGIIERMRINASGNVGIGTTNPVSKLNIVGAIESGSGRNLLQLKNNTDNGLSYTGISLQTGSSIGHSVIQDYGSTYNASTSYDFAGFLNVANSNRGVMLHANSADGVIKFYTGHNEMMGAGVERMCIDQNGNIGIGRKTFESYYNPKLWLHNGWLQVSDSTNHDAGIVVSHLNKTGYGYARTVHQVFEGVNGDPFTEFRIRSNNDDFTITSWSVGADNDDEDKFKINLRTNHPSGSSPSYGDNLFTLTPAGNVGIGTGNPKAKLEIADGDVYIKHINKGIIMTSPDGQCWRGTINNSGLLEFVSIECP